MKVSRRHNPKPGPSCPRFSFTDSLSLLGVECLVCIFNGLIVAIASSGKCSSEVLQPFCWNWTLLALRKECFALCSVRSY